MPDNLLEVTRRLVEISSVSHDESAIADFVERELRRTTALEVTRIGDNVVARSAHGRSTRVILAGHLDTVPPAGNDHARIEGSRLYGIGSSDMKSGLAVLLHLATELVDPAFDLSFVFYCCEEVDRSDSGLLVIESARPDLLAGDVAIIPEPTSVRVEAGCQGVVRLAITAAGRRAHAARPWMGTNAIHRMGAILEQIAAFPERRPVIDGCEYRETLQATSLSGGVATNVVPDAASVVVSHRFAPDRDADTAIASLREFLAPVLDPALGDSIAIVARDHPAAAPGLSHPVLAELVAATGVPPVAKLGWTDVAFFVERGVPAANFGPGNSLLAHTPDEFVDADELDEVALVLMRVLGAPTLP